MPTARPQWTSMPGMSPTRKASASGVVEGLLRLAGIAQRPFDEVVHQRDGDIGHEQAGDRLVDAAIVAQRADRADPDAAGEHAGERHQRRCRRQPGAPASARADRRRREAAEHDRALAADDDEAEPRRQGDAERREEQRRGARQVFWSEKPGAEAAAIDE